MTTITTLVRQSFDIFQTYGRDANALSNLTAAFIDELKDFEEIEIVNSFKNWRSENSVMPTPADISKPIRKRRDWFAKNHRHNFEQTRNNDWSEKTEYEKANLEKVLSAVKERLSQKESTPWKPFDSEDEKSHWNRTTPEMRDKYTQMILQRVRGRQVGEDT